MGIENPVHLAFIAVVALLVLGPKRLPELARALGKGVREFREAISLGADGDRQAPPLPAPPPVQAAQPTSPTHPAPAAGPMPPAAPLPGPQADEVEPHAPPPAAGQPQPPEV